MANTSQFCLITNHCNTYSMKSNLFLQWHLQGYNVGLSPLVPTTTPLFSVLASSKAMQMPLVVYLCQSVLVKYQFQVMLKALDLSEEPISASTIKSLTNKDPVLPRVRGMVQHGTWSSASSEDPTFRPFKQRDLELSIQDGCIL